MRYKPGLTDKIVIVILLAIFACSIVNNVVKYPDIAIRTAIGGIGAMIIYYIITIIKQAKKGR